MLVISELGSVPRRQVEVRGVHLRAQAGAPVRPVHLLHGVTSLCDPVGHRATLELLVPRFKHVFYVPGNHELWHYDKDGVDDSMGKFFAVLELVTELGRVSSVVAPSARLCELGNKPARTGCDGKVSGQ